MFGISINLAKDAKSYIRFGGYDTTHMAAYNDSVFINWHNSTNSLNWLLNLNGALYGNTSTYTGQTKFALINPAHLFIRVP